MAAKGQVTARAQVVTAVADRDRIAPGRVLVVRDLNDDLLPYVREAAALVAERGGLTSHCAIWARELGIPVVVEVANATRCFRTGQMLRVDGDRGRVYEVEERTGSQPERRAISVPETRSATATQLLVNLSHPGVAEAAARLPVDGVGLVRSELIAAEIWERWPDGDEALQEQLSSSMERLARAFAPRPVFYRSFDGRSEPNRRGPLADRADPRRFDWELAALARARRSGCDNLHLLLPFVRDAEDVRFGRDRLPGDRSGSCSHISAMDDGRSAIGVVEFD